MALTRKQFWMPVALAIQAAFGFMAVAPPAHAIPAFARKYGVKCYQCHTIPPALNKTGYLFKRLGYRLPPDEMGGSEPVPKISYLDRHTKFTIANSTALVVQGALSLDKADSSASRASLSLDEASLFAAGSLPRSNFSYFAQYVLYDEGKTTLERAVVGYTGGRANSSYFVKAGEMYIQEGEGTRAAMCYNLFPEPSPVLAGSNALNFSLEQHPLGVNAGYTWVSHDFKQIIAISAKVTNGLDANGKEILFDSVRNSKDLWLNADYWFGPDGGVTFIGYYGRKSQVENQGAADEFTYRPNVRRYGIFGNYLFFDRLDVLGGYMRGRDDWKDTAYSPATGYTSNGYRAELDYYLERGFAVMTRYDRVSQAIASTRAVHTQGWGAGAEKALTQSGNVVVRATYNQERNIDPVTDSVVRDKLFKLDLRLMW